MVENNRSSLFGLLLRDSLGAAATAKIRAGLLRLARRLVDNVSLENTLGLHGSNPSQNVQHLLIARKGDLAVEAQLVHGEQSRVRTAVGGTNINMQYPLVRMRRSSWGSIRRAACAASLIGAGAEKTAAWIARREAMA